MSRKNGNTVNSKWYGYMEYTISTTSTAVTVKVTEVGFHCSANDYKSTNVGAKLTGTSTYSTSGKSAGGNTGSDYGLLTTDRTFTYSRGASATTKTISFSVTAGGSIAGGTSSGSISVSVPEAYVAPTVKCKAYRVSASEGGYAPAVDANGTRGYYEITLSGGKNWTLSTGHTLTINGGSCSISRDGTSYTFYGYTLAGAIPEGTKATATASIKLYAMGTAKSVTGTTYIAPVSNLIDVAPNCVSIGAAAPDGLAEMSFYLMGDPVKDHVVEQGKSNNWFYQKWASGQMVAYRRFYWSSITFTSATGGGYTQKTNLALPDGFIDTPFVVMTPQSGNYVSVNVANVSKTSCDMNIARHFGSGALSNYYFGAIAFGQWR